MTYSGPHLLLTLNGTLGAGTGTLETWTTGVRLNLNGGTADTLQLQFNANAIWPASASLIANVCGPAAKLTHIKLASLDAEGHYIGDEAPGNYAAATPGGGNNNGTPYPFQVALAVTTLTAATRGPGCRGRFFLPVPQYALDPDGRMNVSDAASVATKAVAWLVAIKALMIGANHLVPTVYSQAASGPIAREITGVRVGRVMDTMRSRRRSLQESPVQVNMP